MERNCIYITDNSHTSLRVLEFLYKTQKILNITFYLNSPTKKIEEKILNLQKYLLGNNCPVFINTLNWKDAKLFKPSFQSLLNSCERRGILILVEARSLKMFHTHFRYKDLLQEFNVLMMVFSKPKNLIWAYSPQLLKWSELSMNHQNLYFGQLEEALRNSQTEETPERFEHTIRVVSTAWDIMLPLTALKERMKMRVLIACAYHDFAKNWNIENLKSSFIKKHPRMKDLPIWALHGPVAAFYLKIRNLVKNPSILKAIECHTIPPKKLGIIGKLVVIADKLEPLKEKNFPPEVFCDLWSHLKLGDYEYVYEYLRLNPNIKKR
ncbi:bis(5'-nucleosyl)-tetraphosphatase (symmetrical) YqeK [Candidatus Mycoplasma haematominutum]|uniref:bis(5'-nucleosyl)-tetraphosphatase (symmetrical) YqeK n=1 Tax=Candidatus Mycoplasma haematominutum TaxID=209446 RepID=UPI0005C4705B|nr:bis(5'-nucleosyl)-tetraphosphatase (symmetrical) YqeK [Candidatus Mycoplasma haematominutum]